ncbi:DUF2934 domain-containing protein [Bradyrhizobium sp. USDA 4486]
MEYLPELRRLEHQLELANRAVALIADRVIVARLEDFAEEIGDRLRRLKAESVEEAIRRRAHELWQGAGQPVGRDLEFWLRAEREVKDRETKS